MRAAREGSPERRAALRIVGLGVAVRLVFLALAWSNELYKDEAEYAYLGLVWSRLGVYVGSVDWLWPPGYPAFLAAAFTFCGEHALEAARTCQVLLSAAVGFSVFWLALRLFSLRAARIAGLLWAFYLPLIGFTHSLWAETLLLCVFLPGLCLYLRALLAAPPHPAALELAGAGFLLGLAVLIKEAALLPIALLAAGFVFLDRANPWPRRCSRGVVLCLAVLVVVTPWALRNEEVYGRPVPGGSTLGQNLFYGVNAQYSNFDYAELGVLVDNALYRWLLVPPERALWQRSEEPSVVARSGEDLRKAAAFVQEHPGFFLRTRLKKLADWFTPHSFFVRHFRLGLYSGVLALPGIRHLLITLALLTTAGTCLAAVPGFFWGLRGGVARGALALVFLGFLLPAFVVSSSRFRVPVEPLWIVLAAGFLAGTRRPWLARRGATAAVLVGAALVLALWGVNALELGKVLEVTY